MTSPAARPRPNLALHRHRVLQGGPTTRSTLRRLFGISGEMVTRNRYDVTAAWWIEGSLRVEVAGASFGAQTLWLMPPDARDAYLRTPALAIAYEDTGRGLAPDVDRLLQHMQGRLAPVGLPDLLQVLLDDPELHEVFGDPHFGSQAHETLGATDTNHGAAQGASVTSSAAARLTGPWGEFFSDAAIERSTVASLQFRLPTLHIYHGNHECLFTTPGFPTRLMHLYNYPWSRHEPVHALLAARRAEEAGEGAGTPGTMERFSTDMGDLDVIMGAEERLAAAVQHVLARRRDEIVSVHCSCLPMVMGEDLARATADLREDIDVPIFFTDQLTHDPRAVLRDMLVAARPADGAATTNAAPSTPFAFNFIGFPDCNATAELTAVMERAGATLNALLVPEVDLDGYRRAPRAAVQIFFENARHEPIYRAAFRGLVPEEVTPPPPFGLAGTARFFEDVARSFATLGDEGVALSEKLLRAAAAGRTRVAERFARLQSLTGGGAVGFVVDERHIAKLFVPARCFGVPLVAMLQEMELGVHLFCFARADEDTSASLPDYAEGLEGVSCTRFHDRTELADALASQAVQAVYSDIFFDHRLTGSGLSQFAMSDFEMGFDGALRTFERLARRVRLPFYRRYAPFLRRETRS